MNTKTMSNSINAPPTVTDFPLSLIFKLFSDPGMFQQIITAFSFLYCYNSKSVHPGALERKMLQ